MTAAIRALGFTALLLPLTVVASAKTPPPVALDRAPHRLRLDGGLGYLHETGRDDHFDSATLSAAALYRYEISKTSEAR